MENQLEQVRIKKVGVISLANTLALSSLFIALVLGIIIGLMAMVSISSFSSTLSPLGVKGPTKGQIALIFFLIFPVIAAVIGFIQGIIIGLFYNLSSKMTKGISLYS